MSSTLLIDNNARTSVYYHTLSRTKDDVVSFETDHSTPVGRKEGIRFMISKKLIQLLDQSIIYVKKAIVYNWLSLLCNIAFIYSVASIIYYLYLGTLSVTEIAIYSILCIIVMILRYFMQKQAVYNSYQASVDVKVTLRKKIYNKLLQLGTGYQQKMSTAEVVQVSMEGVDQLEIYFSRYLPQLFYSLLAPLTLFIVISMLVNIKIAAIFKVVSPCKFSKKLSPSSV